MPFQLIILSCCFLRFPFCHYVVFAAGMLSKDKLAVVRNLLDLFLNTKFTFPKLCLQ